MLFWESKGYRAATLLPVLGRQPLSKLTVPAELEDRVPSGRSVNLGIRGRPVLPQSNHDTKRPRSWRKIAKLFPEENVHFEAAALADKLIRAMDAASMRHMDQIAKAGGKSSQ